MWGSSEATAAEIETAINIVILNIRRLRTDTGDTLNMSSFPDKAIASGCLQSSLSRLLG